MSARECEPSSKTCKRHIGVGQADSATEPAIRLDSTDRLVGVEGATTALESFRTVRRIVDVGRAGTTR